MTKQIAAGKNKGLYARGRNFTVFWAVDRPLADTTAKPHASEKRKGIKRYHYDGVTSPKRQRECAGELRE